MAAEPTESAGLMHMRLCGDEVPNTDQSYKKPWNSLKETFITLSV